MDEKKTAPEVEAPGRKEFKEFCENMQKMMHYGREMLFSLVGVLDALTREK